MFIFSTFVLMSHCRQIIFLLLIGLVACSNPEEDRAGLPATVDDGIRSEAFGLEYLFSDSLSLRAKLSAAHQIERLEGEEEKKKENKEIVIYLDGGVKIDFYNNFGTSHSKITSERGIYRKDKNLAELKGNVVLTNAKGEKLETEQLFWDEKKDQVYTDEYVRIYTDGKII